MDNLLGIPVVVTPWAPRGFVALVDSKIVCDLIGFWMLCEQDERRRSAPKWDEGWEG